jgi:hypothetical protein
MLATKISDEVVLLEQVTKVHSNLVALLLKLRSNLICAFEKDF